MDTGLFIKSAEAAAPWIATPATPVGARIEAAVTASLKAAGCNTNLGIVLLCAPLAAAAEAGDGPLRVHLDAVLDHLTVADAQAAYRAIGHANPAGLGAVSTGDVAFALVATSNKQPNKQQEGANVRRVIKAAGKRFESERYHTIISR